MTPAAADTEFYNTSKMSVNNPNFQFTPTINKKSAQIQRKEPVGDILFGDAQRRQQKQRVQ